MARIKQRDLTRTMKAAKAAGFSSFELVDRETGLIFRVVPGRDYSPANDLDAELERFEARVGG